MPYYGDSWSKRGGDDAESSYLRRLEAAVAAEGPLHPKRSMHIPDGVKSVVARLVDIVSREEFTIAGVFDELAGTGEGKPGRRLARELIGGTRLGDALGVAPGDKESWSDVLGQQGVGEGGRLSDVIGHNAVTKYLDPSVRGTAGMALSVLTSPLTYTGIGLGTGAVRVMGKGGQIALSKSGAKLVTVQYEKALAALARKHGVEIGAEGLLGVERNVLKLERDARLMTHLGEQGINEVADKLRERAGRVVGRAVEQGVLPAEATTRRAIRFGDLGLFGRAERGVELISTAKLTAPARAIANQFDNVLRRSEKVGNLLDDIDSKVTAIHDLFNAVPRLAKRVPGLTQLVQNRDARRRGAVALSEDIINEQVFGGKKNFRKLGDDALSALADAAEGVRPEAWVKLATDAGFSQEWATGVVKSWHDLAAQMGGLEVRLDMQDAAAVASRAGKYVPHVVEGVDGGVLGKLAVQSGYKASSMRTGSVGRFAEVRHFETRDELRAFLAEHKDKFPKARIVESGHELMVRRLAAHIGGVADANFIDDTISLYRATPDRVFKTLYDEVGAQAGDNATAKMTSGELETAAAHVNGAGDPADLLTMRGDLRAGVMQEILRRTDSIESFEAVVRRYEPVLEKMGIGGVRGLTTRSAAGLRGVMYGGKPYVEYAFPEGSRLAGRQVVLPEAVVDSIKRMGATWLDVPEAGEMLRLYDRAINFTKMTQTGLFPSFNGRNAYSNVLASMLDIGVAALNPKLHKHAIAIMLNRDGTLVTAAGQRIPYEAIRASARGLDIWQDILGFADIVPTKTVLRETEESGKIAALKRAVLLPSRAIENEARLMHYVAQLERGTSFQDAARITKQFLFDYQDLSITEKQAFRRIFPYYTWQRKSLELHLKELATHPGRVLAPLRLSEAGPGPDYLPEYVRGDIKLRLKSLPGKAGDTFLTGVDMPVTSLNNLWAGSVGKTIRENLGMLTPFLKNPLEFGLNTNTFNGQTVKGRQFMGRLGPLLQRMPEPLRDWIELEKIGGKDGSPTYYKANGLKVWVLFKGPLVGRLTSESVTAEEMYREMSEGDGGAQLLKLLTGLTLREYDLSEAQRLSAKEKIRQLEDYLIESGRGRELRQVYVPKETVQ